MSEQVRQRPIQQEDAADIKARLHAQAAAPAGATWHFLNFATTDTAAAFVNAAPPQGSGEISANARNDGTVGMFYFL